MCAQYSSRCAFLAVDICINNKKVVPLQSFRVCTHTRKPYLKYIHLNFRINEFKDCSTCKASARHKKCGS